MPSCYWCEKPFTRDVRQPRQAYCSKPCTQAAGNLELARARRIYRALYGAATARDKSRGADMTFLMREARAWAAEDKAKGRRAPPRHTHEEDRGHQRESHVSPTVSDLEAEPLRPAPGAVLMGSLERNDLRSQTTH